MSLIQSIAHKLLPAAAFALPPASTQFSNSFDMSGFTAGFYGGCHVQLGVWVVGAEGDWSLNNQADQAFGGGICAALQLVDSEQISLFGMVKSHY
jgi:hypothetical protein